MKILHINSADRGGAALCAIRAHLGLLEANIDSEIYFLWQKDHDLPHARQHAKRYDNRIVKFLKQTGILFDAANENEKRRAGKVSGPYMFSFANSPYKLADFVNNHKCDLVHLHWVSEFVDYQEFFQNVKKPIVWTLLDMNPFTGGCHHSSGCLKFMETCSECPQLKGTIDWNNAAKNQKYKRQSVGSANLTIAPVAHWMETYSRKSSLFKSLPHKRIASGIDMNLFRIKDRHACRKAFGIPEDKTIIGVVADYNSYGKGMDLLNDAFQMLEENLNVELCLMGRVSDENLVARSRPLGRLAGEQVADFYNACDLFAIPSREDNFPNTMIESIACGIPVVAFNTGGLPEVIKNWNNGLIAPEMTPESLHGRLVESINNLDKFNRNNIRQNAVENYSIEVMTRNHIELYEKILNHAPLAS